MGCQWMSYVTVMTENLLASLAMYVSKHANKIFKYSSNMHMRDHYNIFMHTCVGIYTHIHTYN